MEILPIVTGLMIPPKDDLCEKIARADVVLQEYDVVAVSSKVVAIDEGRCTKKSESVGREVLAKREADAFIERAESPGGHTLITRMGSAFVGFSGVDPLGEYYVLWPSEPQKSAERLLSWLKKQYGISHLGLVITDSHSVPLRRGVIGFAIAWAGFQPLVDSGKTEDFFGGVTTGTTINLPDSLAAAANLVMGEGNEQTPLAIIRGAPYIQNPLPPRRGKEGAFEVLPEEDIYAPFFKQAPWKSY